MPPSQRRLAAAVLLVVAVVMAAPTEPAAQGGLPEGTEAILIPGSAAGPPYRRVLVPHGLTGDVTVDYRAVENDPEDLCGDFGDIHVTWRWQGTAVFAFGGAYIYQPAFAIPGTDHGGTGSFDVEGMNGPNSVVDLTPEQVSRGLDAFEITFDVAPDSGQPLAGMRIGGNVAYNIPVETDSGTVLFENFVFLNQTLRLEGTNATLPGTVQLGAASLQASFDVTGRDPEAFGGCAIATAHVTANLHGDIFDCGTDPIDVTRSGAVAANGWSAEYNISDLDGLELRDVRLGTRYFAERIHVPYFELKTSDFDSGGHCELRPNESSPQGSACTSRLIHFQNSGSALEAIYEIDDIPANTNSCLIVKQSYFFGPYDLGGCEPSGGLPCHMLMPTVDYQYIPADSQETLTSATFAQRFHFAVDAANGPHASWKPQASTLFKTLDFPPVVVLPIPAPNCQLPIFPLGGLFFPNSYNPLCEEISGNAIVDGQSADVDDFHQTSRGFVLEPGLGFQPIKPWVSLAAGGCPECAHTHWRWPAYLPDFGSGVPRIPPGSKQSVEVGVALYRPGPEEHPANDFHSLMDGESIVNSFNRLGNEPLAFWYVGTGTNGADSFMTHGLFFSPTGQPLLPFTGQLVKTGLRFSRALQLWAQTVDIVNTSDLPITGPIFLVLDSLSPNATLYNAMATTQYNDPVGSPYLPVDLPENPDEPNQLAPGASTTVNLMFSDPSKAGINYTPRLIAGGMP